MASVHGAEPLGTLLNRSPWSLEELVQPPGNPALLGQLQAQLATVNLRID